MSAGAIHVTLLILVNSEELKEDAEEKRDKPETFLSFHFEQLSSQGHTEGSFRLPFG